MSKSRLKKIMFYIGTISEGGGAERVITNLASQFTNDGFDVILTTLYTVKNEYAVSTKVKRIVVHDTKVPYEILAKSSLFDKVKRVAIRLLKLRKIFKDEKPDLVIAFMDSNNIGAILASIGLKNKTVISVRAAPEMEYPGKKGWLVSRFILPLASGCVFQTEEAKAWFPVKLQNKSAVILNSVNPKFFNAVRCTASGEIVTCGRLETPKNHLMLIDAINELHKKYPEINLKIYGEGSLKNKLSEHITNLKANDFIRLMGRTNDVVTALSSAEVFVLTSDYEGMPNALMEAMAAGLPCISTDCPCGGPRTLINNMENGILIPVGNTEELIKQIEFLFFNKDKANKISYNARKRAEDFMPDKVYLDWKNYFEAVLNKK